MQKADKNDYGSNIEQLVESLDLIRDFFELIEPFIKEKNDGLREKNLKHLLPFELAILKLETHKLNAGKERDEELTIEGKEVEKIRHRIQTIEQKLCDRVVFEIEEDSIKIKFSDIRLVNEMDDAIKSLSIGSKRIDLLYKSSLITLISSVEWFFSQILHAHYQKYPDAVTEKSGQNFTFSDLKKFDSIEDARKFLLNKKIDSVIRQGFCDWLDFIENNLKLAVVYMQENRDSLSEIFLRRNLLVHNNGIINNVYLNSIKKQKDHLKEGEAIPVDKDYLFDAINKCEIAFITLASELWKKESRADEEETRNRFDIINEISYQHLAKERYCISKELSKFLMEEDSFKEHYHLMAKFNFWQSKKWLGEIEDVREEIQEVDLSAKQSLFRLTRLALLDDFDEFFKLLPSVINSNELQIEQLEIWPIFKECRKREEYITYIENQKREASPIVLALPSGN